MQTGTAARRRRQKIAAVHGASGDGGEGASEAGHQPEWTGLDWRCPSACLSCKRLVRPGRAMRGVVQLQAARGLVVCWCRPRQRGLDSTLPQYMVGARQGRAGMSYDCSCARALLPFCDVGTTLSWQHQPRLHLMRGECEETVQMPPLMAEAQPTLKLDCAHSLLLLVELLIPCSHCSDSCCCCPSPSPACFACLFFFFFFFFFFLDFAIASAFGGT